MTKQTYTVYESGRDPYTIEYDAEEKRKVQRDDRQDFATERAQRIRRLIELKTEELDKARDAEGELKARGDVNWRPVQAFGDLIEAEIRGLLSALQILVGTRA